MNEVGNIVYRSNIIFKDTNLIDHKIGGHPTLTLHKSDDGIIYYMTITTNSGLKKYGHKLLRIGREKCNNLENSYINLDYIYKTKDDGYGRTSLDFVSYNQMTRIFEEIIKYFDKIRENDKDELTKEELDEIFFNALEYLKIYCPKRRKKIIEDLMLDID